MTRWQEQSNKFHRLLRHVGELHDKKGADYGSADGVCDDQYANIRASAEFGIKPWIGAVLRANDKMARIKTYCRKGKLANESLKDSILDAAVYFLNAYQLLEEDEKSVK